MLEPVEAQEPARPEQPSAAPAPTRRRRPRKPPGPIRRALARVPQWGIALILCAPALVLTPLDAVGLGWKLAADVLLLPALLFPGAIHRGRWAHAWGVLGVLLLGLAVFHGLAYALFFLPPGGPQWLAPVLPTLMAHSEYGWLMDAVMLAVCLGFAELLQSGRRSWAAFGWMLLAAVGSSALVLLVHELLFRGGLLTAGPGWDGMGRYRWVAVSFATLRAVAFWWMIPLAVRAAKAERPAGRRVVGWLSAAAVAGFVAWFAVTGPALPPVGVTVSPETTFLTGPLNDDGTVNYVEAVNQERAEGVTPANNAAVPLVEAVGEGSLNLGDLFDPCMRRLGMDPPPAEGRWLLFETEFETLATLVRPTTGPAGEARELQASEELRRTARQVLAGEPFELSADLREELQNVTRRLRPYGTQSELDKDVTKATRAPWSAADLPRVAAWLDAMAVPLDRVVEAAHRERYWFPQLSTAEPANCVELRIPSVAHVFAAGRTLAARAMRKAGEGDLPGAWDDVLAVQRLARHLSNGTTLVECLVGLAMEGLAADATHAMVAGGRLDTATASAVLKRMLALPPLRGALSAVQRERYMALDSVIMFYRGDGMRPAVARLARDRIDWDEVLRTTNLFWDLNITFADPCREADGSWVEAAHRRYDRIYARYKGTPEAPVPLARNIVRALVGGPRGTRAELAGLLAAGFGLASVREIGYACFISDRQLAQGALARIELALEAHRLRTGRLPETLDALVPHELPALPGRELCGHPLYYEPAPDGSYRLRCTQWHWGTEQLGSLEPGHGDFVPPEDADAQ